MSESGVVTVNDARVARRRKTALLTVTAASVVMALLAVFALELANTQAKSKNDVKARVHERATLATALIDSLFQSTSNQAPLNARRYGGRVVSDSTLEAHRQTNSYLVLLDPAGHVIAHSSGFTAQAQANLSQSAALKLVRAGRPYGLGDVLPYGNSSVIDFAVPVRTAFGRRILLSGLPPKVLSAFIGGELRKIPGVRGAHSYLIDGRNTVISSTNPQRPPGYVFRSASQRKALSQPTGDVSSHYYDQVHLSNATWRVVLAAPDKQLFAAVSGVRKWLPWTIFFAFAIVTGLAFVLARRAFRSSDEARASSVQLGLLNAELASSNDELERRAKELARSNDELDQFASIASHDLQEPLRKVRTFTQQLTVIEAERLSDKGRDYLQRTNAAAERMQRLIEDLLRFSRVATQSRPFTRVDLDTLTSEVLGDLEHEIERSDAALNVGPLPVISGDETQLRQLMQNLLSNALKFRRDGVRPEIDVEAIVRGDIASITVRDNGIGFEPQYEQRIFRVFERLHGRTTYPGTGIGLALCRKIAERHGGSMHAHGEPGVGSTFTVTLPVNQREEVVVLNPPDVREGVAEEREPAHA